MPHGAVVFEPKHPLVKLRRSDLVAAGDDGVVELNRHRVFLSTDGVPIMAYAPRERKTKASVRVFGVT